MARTKDEKKEHVRRSGQTRDHTCHWPDCTVQVPPAKWGCYRHWMLIPKQLRDRIWDTYKVSQEATMSPSREYVEAARAVQQWIEHRYPSRSSSPAKDDTASFEYSKKTAPPLAGDTVRGCWPTSPALRSQIHTLALHFARAPREIIPLTQLVLETFSERAAVIEYLGGHPRQIAEVYAIADVVEYLNRKFVPQTR